MLKIILPGAQQFHEPVMQLVKRSSRGLRGQDRQDLIKRAGEEFVYRIQDVEVPDDEQLVHLLALGATERYGCFAAGTPIAMADGAYCLIQHVEVGDTVLSAEGNVCEVVHLFARAVPDTLTLDVCGLANELQSSADHPYRVARYEQFACDHDKYKRCLPPTFGQQNICNRPTTKTRECVLADYRSIAWEWATAENIREGDFLVWTAPQNLPAPIELTVAEGYILGAWLAEGCFQRNTSNKAVASLRLSMHVEEAEFLASLQLYGRSLGWTVRDHVYSGEKSENERTVCITGNPPRFRIWQALFGEHVDGKHVPPWVCCLPREIRLAIVAGYLDGDGSCVVDDKENRTTARSHGRELSLGLQRLCWSLGFPAVACAVHSTDNETNLSIANSYLADVEAYSWKIRGRELKQTTKVHGFYHAGRMYLPVREIRKSDAATVYNFEVAGDHTYSGPNVDSHNCNRNGDGFKRATCQRRHDTFVKHAQFYRNHKTDNPRVNFGQVKLSAFNPKMDRVELLVALNCSKEAAARNRGLVADREMQKLAKDEEIPVSMGCSVPEDVCSYCGNHAPNRNHYCHGIKEGGHCKAGGLYSNMGQLVEIDGGLHHLHADNPDPTWRDISHVDRPADRIAYVMGAFRKAAGLHREPGGAELAEILGTTLPADVVLESWPRHLRHFAKAASAAADAELLLDLLPPETLRLHAGGLVPATAALPTIPLDKAAAYLQVLADHDVCLPLSQFLAVTTGLPAEQVVAVTKQAQACLPGMFSRMLQCAELPSSIEAADSSFQSASRELPIRKLAQAHAAYYETSADGARRRATLQAIRGENPGESRSASNGEYHKRASAANDLTATRLATGYGIYQLQFLARCEDDDKLALTAQRLVMQNCVW